MVRTIRDERQLPLIKPESDWRPQAVFPDLKDHAELALDTETYDPGIAQERGSSWALGDGRIVGFTVATSAWSRYYPIGHPEDNLDADVCLNWLRAQLRTYAGTIVGQNLGYDLGWLGRYDVHAPSATFRDVMYNAAILDENQKTYNLNAIATRLGLSPKDETLLREAADVYMVDAKSGLYKLPARYVGDYAERDGALPLEIWRLQRPLIEQDKLTKVVKVENDLLPLNLEMRRRGVLVDQDRCQQVRRQLLKLERERDVEIKRISGLEVSVWEPRSVATAFMAVGVEFPTTALHQPSFTAEWLESHPHPLTKLVREARVFNKARRDFIDSMLLEHLGTDGRVHPEWHPLRGNDAGTVGGRYACTDPNLQQVPARDPIVGPLVRSCFKPERDERWVTHDVKQQEPRFMVHYAALANISGAMEAVERIRADPNTDFHQMVADMTGLPRKQAKPINLGKAYGMGGAKLCDELGLPTKIWRKRNADGSETPIRVAGDEGKAIIAQYDQRFPYVAQLSSSCEKAAQHRGWIRTYLGRLCRFYEWESSEWGSGPKERFLSRELAVERLGTDNVRRSWTHKALNRLIQGSSGDMIKLAMLKVWRETKRVPLLTIHDELDVSNSTDVELREVDRCVRESVELLVPMSTDVEVGPSWGETTPWEETT